MTTNGRSLAKPDGFRGKFLTDLAARAAYSEAAGPYRMVPSAVAIPTETDDLINIIRTASAEGWSLIPRGAGSGIPGNNVGPGIILDLQLFNRPLFVSANLSTNAGAAITLAELQRAARHLSLRLPPDPSSADFCTVGGMVATNAAGPRSLKYGSIRKWVRGVEFVTADGDVAWLGRAQGNRVPRSPRRRQQRALKDDFAAGDRFARDVQPSLAAQADILQTVTPRTTKNSSGYGLSAYAESGDLVDLVIGSEGTLGVVTRVELDLATEAQARSTVLLALNDLTTLPDAVAHLNGLEPSACELLDRTLLELARIPDLTLSGVEAVLLVEFERPNEAAARGVAGDAVRGTSTWCAYAKTGITVEQTAELWDVRHAASAALSRLPETRRSLQIVEDGCVPVARLGDYLAGVRTAAARLNLEIVAFGHAGDGHLHVNVLCDTTKGDFATRLQALLDAVTDLVVRLGGTLSGEHGDGRLRAPLLDRVFGVAGAGLFAAVKRAFDPRGIFNPGVIVGSASPLGSLKVGDAREQIPPAIALQLREVEHTRAWGRSKLDLIEDALTAEQSGAEP